MAELNFNFFKYAQSTSSLQNEWRSEMYYPNKDDFLELLKAPVYKNDYNIRIPFA